MEAFAKALRHFILRDAAYITGGGMVLTAFLYAFDRLGAATLAAVPFGFYILATAIAHAVGFAVADTASWLAPSVFPSRPLREPPKLTKWLFERKTDSTWSVSLAPVDMKNSAEKVAEQEFGPYHRLVFLRHVGLVEGLCAILSALLLLLRMARHGVTGYDGILAAMATIGGVLLIVAGGVKSAQQADYLQRQAGPPLSPDAHDPRC